MATLVISLFSDYRKYSGVGSEKSWNSSWPEEVPIISLLGLEGEEKEGRSFRQFALDWLVVSK
jgi:hypothetical protein